MVTASDTTRRFPVFAPTDEQRAGPAFARPRPLALAHALTEDQLDCFWSQGYVNLPGLFSEQEGEAFQEAAGRVYRDSRVDPKNHRYDFAAQGDGMSVLWKIDPFFDLDDVFRKAVFDRRILDALASIYEGREPRLFKDKLICKPPHTHGNGLHQDYNWWQGYPTSLISVTVSIDAATEANGCTVVYPRPPHGGFCGTPGSFDNGETLQADASIDSARAVRNITRPGDVLIFHCFTPHEAGPNTTDTLRRQMFLTYNDSADGEHYFSHGEHYRAYVDADIAKTGRDAKTYFL